MSDSTAHDPHQPLHHRSPVGTEILSVERLRKEFPGRWRLTGPRRLVHAVDDVSFTLRAGETLGLVGESGCGKSTTGRCVMRLLEPTSGEIWFKGRELAGARASELREIRREVQMVFQDPYASLDPRLRVADIVAEPLRVHGRYHGGEGRARVHELLEQVGLGPEHGRRYPHEFSGGQRQRIGIARALALQPQVLLLDEPVSALDVSVQAQAVNLLQELQEALGLSYLFIAHDLSVVRHICDRVAVMYLGRIVEVGTRDEIFDRPLHPYTQALLSAVPVTDPDLRGRRDRIVLEGEVPSAASPPSGCNFRTRCWKAEERCEAEDPALVDRFDHGHPSACHFAELLERT